MRCLNDDEHDLMVYFDGDWYYCDECNEYFNSNHDSPMDALQKKGWIPKGTGWHNEVFNGVWVFLSENTDVLPVHPSQVVLLTFHEKKHGCIKAHTRMPLWIILDDKFTVQ